MEMETLEDLRKGHGLTQGELAGLFGVSDRTIYNLEKDSSNIRDSLLQKYMAAFEVSYDEIFLGTEYEKNVFEEKRMHKIVSNLKDKQEA